MAGMRDCYFCTEKDSVDKSKRAHVDLQCPYASKKEKDELVKERADKAKAKRDAWRERVKAKGSAGSAKLVQAGNAIDDADERAAERIFGGGGAATLLDLGDIIDTELGATGHARMAASKAAPRGRLSEHRARHDVSNDTTVVE